RLQADEGVLTAITRKHEMNEPPLGSRVRLAGAWSLPPPELKEQIGPALWLGWPPVVGVLSAPEAARPGRDGNASLWIGCALGGSVLAGVIAVRSRRSALRISSETEAA